MKDKEEQKQHIVDMMKGDEELGLYDESREIKLMENTFTIEEIRKYILSQDSLGDALYNLSSSKILEANQPEQDELNWDELDDDEIKEMYQ